MLHIHPDDLRAALADHLPQLASAQAEINEADPLHRKAVIEKYRPLWASVKPLLEKLSDRKCWYSECLSAGAPTDVDHFRPKQAVVGTSPHHPGYYWLALAWTNLRLSCQRVNRRETDPTTGIVGGKGAHFPLVDASKRAYRPTDAIDDEEPLFLDPIVATDVAMLSFDSDGKIALHPRFLGDDTAMRRLEASRIYLNLDWHQFIGQRKLLYWKISDLVEHAEKHAPAPGSPANDEFKQRIKEIVTLIKRNSEYSRAANVYVRSFRSRWWVESILLELMAA